MTFDQAEFQLRCEWGERGLYSLLPTSDVIVVIDVLSFTTCVDIAISRGAKVWPYRWNDHSANSFAGERNAILAGSRSSSGVSLSPASMLQLESGDAIVLPSLNGATLSVLAGGSPLLAACLRNAESVARAACKIGPRVSVIPSGERWPDGTLRPCLAGC
ncbi:MAG: 2-phosphosulfolactate phosphatase [Candidatus Eisenbacteria sp.]|nr:2-phosphosulfolactate phosphatase [Candidatus Eisenbacteria bacterium]